MDKLVEAEFSAVRDEINMRTQLGVTIVGFDLAALGTGLSLVAKTPSVALALAVVSACLWMLWLDQAIQVWKLAAYAALRLAPRAGPGVLQWESFLRDLDEGGTDATTLIRPGQPGDVRVVPRLRTRNIGFYISILLGGTPVVLVIGFLISKQADHSAAAIWLELVLAAAVWANSTRLYLSFRKLSQTLDDAIRQAPPPPAGDA